jgi:ATP-dependent DNA ligase
MTEERLGEHRGKYVQLAPRVVCTGTDHVEKMYQEILMKDGEGVILRDPQSPYKSGRSRGYLKHKVQCVEFMVDVLLTISLMKKFRDAEARVIGSSSPHQWLCELYVESFERNV